MPRTFATPQELKSVLTELKLTPAALAEKIDVPEAEVARCLRARKKGLDWHGADRLMRFCRTQGMKALADEIYRRCYTVVFRPAGEKKREGDNPIPPGAWIPPKGAIRALISLLLSDPVPPQGSGEPDDARGDQPPRA